MSTLLHAAVAVLPLLFAPAHGSLASTLLGGNRTAIQPNISEAASLATASGGARWYAEACRSINCGLNPAGVGDVRLLEGGGSAAVVGRLGSGECLVGFRGTANMAGVLDDLKSIDLAPLPGCSGCMVAAGFLNGYNALAGSIKGALNDLGCSQVSLTGHSLGAAEAVIAIYDLQSSGFQISTSYTFGQPRVGNEAFTGAIDAALGGAQLYRIVHGLDPIARAGPRGSTHQGTEIFEPGINPFSDHMHYTGIYMACGENAFIGGIKNLFP